MKIPNATSALNGVVISLARIVSEDSQPVRRLHLAVSKSSKDS